MAVRERTNAGPLTIGALLNRPASTAGNVLRQLGRSRAAAGTTPTGRYERARPGELLHRSARMPPSREVRTPCLGDAGVTDDHRANSSAH